MQRIDQLKELIAGVERSDPFASVDLDRWQRELNDLLRSRAPQVHRAGAVPANNRSVRPPGPVSQRPRHPMPTSQPQGGIGKSGVGIGTLPTRARGAVSGPMAVGGAAPNSLSKAVPKKGATAAAAKPQPQKAKKKPAAVPATNPREPRLVAAQAAWNQSTAWCKEQLRFTTQMDGRVRKAVERFQVLLRGLTAAQDVEQFRKAQDEVLCHRSQHPYLRWAPVPSPLPLGAREPKASPSAQAAPSLARTGSTSTPRRSGGRHSSTPMNEGSALYQRIGQPGRGGLAFDDSIALRKSSPKQQRKLVDRYDRLMSSGSREDWDDWE